MADTSIFSSPPLMQENLEAVGEMTNYQDWIYSCIAPHIGAEVLEAGCGNGNLTKLIMHSSTLRHYVGVDHNKALCEELRNQLYIGANERQDVSWDIVNLDLEDSQLLSLGVDNFDTIVCLNVLEHIKDDDLLLRKFHPLLVPGGKLILFVPAFQWLYGNIDTIVHHFRRYRRTALMLQIQKAGFRIAETRYINALGMLAWIWHSKILRLAVHRRSEMRTWDRFVPALRWFEERLPIPFGLSLFFVAIKD